MENDLLKGLIIVTAIFYFLKGLLYLLLHQATYRIEAMALARRKKRRNRRSSKRQPETENNSQ